MEDPKQISEDPRRSRLLEVQSELKKLVKALTGPDANKTALNKAIDRLEAEENALKNALNPRPGRTILESRDSFRSAIMPLTAPTLTRALLERIIGEAKSYLSLSANGILANPEKITASLAEVAFLDPDSGVKAQLEEILKTVLTTTKLDDAHRLISELKNL